MLSNKQIETLKERVLELEKENQDLKSTMNELIKTVNNDYSHMCILEDRISELERKYEALNNEVAMRNWQK